jgi:hypothetical protein
MNLGIDENADDSEQTIDQIPKYLIQILRVESHASALQQVIKDSGILVRIDDTIFDQIPAVGTFIGLIRSGLNVQAWFLEQKILRFIEGVQEIPLEQRRSFFDQYLDDPSRIDDVGKALIVTLDLFDHLDKPYILAKLLKGRINGEIDEEVFWRLAASIRRAYIEDLRALFRYYSEYPIRHPSWERLHSYGLAKLKFNLKREWQFKIIEDVEVEYEANQDAFILSKLVLDQNVHPWYR